MSIRHCDSQKKNTNESWSNKKRKEKNIGEGRYVFLIWIFRRCLSCFVFSIMSVAVSSRDEMGFARIIYEAMMIVLIALEPVKNSYLKKLVKRLVVVFILGEFMIFAKVFVTYMDISDEWTPIIWRIYEIIRVFISLSLCYPISLFIGENGQKL